MSRRRAARQQEKEEFLQQNPELRKINTRIEVEPPEVILDGENVLEEDDGFDIRVTIDGQPLPEASIFDEENFSGFTLVDRIIVPPIFFMAAIEDFDISDVINGVEDEPEEADISLSASGFGVASSGEEFEDDNEDNGDNGNEPCDDDDGEQCFCFFNFGGLPSSSLCFAIEFVCCCWCIFSSFALLGFVLLIRPWMLAESLLWLLLDEASS